MWRITPEGRRFLQAEAAKYADRASFGCQIDIGKNQTKLLLEAPDHHFSASTIKKICAFTPLFKLGLHYVSAQAGAISEIRLAREHSAGLTLNRGDQRGIELLYEALLQNPAFRGLLPTFDSAAEFREWSALWGNATPDPATEQFFAYRLFACFKTP